MRPYPVKVASREGRHSRARGRVPPNRPRRCEDQTARGIAALRCAESQKDFLGRAREGSLAPPIRLSAYTMHRHSWSILPASLTIFLLHGVALAQDIRCGETQRRTLEQKFDRVSFNARSDEVISITVAPVADPVQDPNFDPEFQLQGPDGDAVFFVGTAKPRVCDHFNHQCETGPLPLDGEYTIVINDTGKKQSGTYTVTLEAVSATAEGQWNGPPTPPPPDAPFCKRFNDAGKADGTQVATIDAPVGGVIDFPGETDTFTFVGTSGQTVSLTLPLLTSAGGSFMPRARLFDPSGQPVGEDCDLDEVCTRGPLSADGVYTVKVFELSYDSVGDYVLL